MQEQYISLSDLRKVSGIGDKTIERIKDQLLQSELDKEYISEYDTNIKLDVNNIYQGDCLELMNGIPDRSIDMILCDLPYGTTKCKWDTIIPFEPLWEQYNRVIKDNGVIALTASQPFTSSLIMSNVENFKEELIWEKDVPSNFVQAKKRHMKYHESIIIFCNKGTYTYNRQMIPRESKRVEQMIKNGNKHWRSNREVNEISLTTKYEPTGFDCYDTKTKNPSTVIRIPRVNSRAKDKTPHPTQKPVSLFEYLIKTYTNEGEIVLDNCIGSGTTAIACMNTDRNYIGIELDENYYNIAKNRINEHKSNICLK